MPNDQQTVNFNNEAGVQLAGRLHLPSGQPRAYALFAHCFTCSKDIPAAERIADRLASHGLAVLRFDFAGLGESGGDFALTNLSSNVTDLVAAADYLEREHRAPTLLIGHSLGGAAVLRAAHQIDSCRAVATLAAPARPDHLREVLEKKEPQLLELGEAELKLGPRLVRITRQLLDDLSSHGGPEDHVGSLRRALLVMHAPGDQQVSIDNATAIFVAARHPKSFVSLDSADHLLTRRDDAEYAADTIAAWSSRYLPPPPRARGKQLLHQTG
ncbi:MAG: alpha/beta hydrolase [Polyangiales bacterium]